MYEEEKITIKFEATDLGGQSHYIAESTFPMYACDESPLVAMGRKFNDFLRQMTYTRDNDYLFMNDVNEEEYYALETFLEDYRKGKVPPRYYHEEWEKENA